MKNIASHKYIQSFVVFTLLATSVSLAGCSSDPVSGQAQSLPSVKVFKVADGGAAGVMANGKVAAAQEIQVVSKLPGKVASVSVDEGTKVKKGQVLVQLEADDYVQQVNQAQAGIAGAEARLNDLKAGARSQQIDQLKSTVDQAKAGYDTAQKAYNRIKSLYDAGAVSQSDLDKVQLDLDKGRTGYEAAKAALDLAQAGATSNSIAASASDVERMRSSLAMAQTTLGNTVIKSPIDGVVSRRSIDPGEMASPAAPLLTIVNMDTVKVEASVSQDQIDQVKQGSKVTIQVNGLPNKTFTGTVEFISPVSDPNSSTFPVKIVVQNTEGLLRAGMIAQVSFSNQPVSRLELPASALVKKDNKTFIYKVDGDTIHQVEVKTESKNADWVYVQSGVQAKDQIVLNPSDKLSDGSRVQVE
ncbi:efflux RND transporter periplasmic adaptor subunit [Brevibacillus ginsengisoli]|uniref:efflux RND transporter periplasmic adaptor subunit n=1 Tax=Brevibacillus ginsengisoli TaxID=363854 RepID=UPI003CF10EC2